MTLIAILLVLALERFVGEVDHLRQFGWFATYRSWLENRLAQRPLWQGPLGVLLLLFPPLLLLGVISLLLYQYSPALDFVLAVLVLLYCLGPVDLGQQIDRYLVALKGGDAEAADLALRGFHVPDAEPDRLAGILGSIMEQTNVRLFAVLFWFVVLGPVGALLYRLAAELHRGYADVHGRFANSVRDLYNLLNWPTVRLLALGQALAGSLVEGLEGWRRHEARRIDVNEQVLRESGLGALQFRSSYEDDTEVGLELQDEDIVSWIETMQGLQHRTLIVWLSVLAIMTIAGWAT